jgi:hypothetical protein
MGHGEMKRKWWLWMSGVIVVAGLLLGAVTITPRLISAQEGASSTPTRPTASATTSPAATTPPALTPTVTPAATRLIPPTPTPRPTALFTVRIFNTINFDNRSLNSIAVDRQGRVYVPDGEFNVLVFSARFAELFRIPVFQPVAVSLNLAQDRLLIGKQYPATIEQYDLSGRFLGKLWDAQNTTLECLAVDSQNSIYIIHTLINKPYTRFLTRIDPNGNVIFLRVFADDTREVNQVYGIAFQPDSTLNIAVSGYDRAEDLVRLWLFSPAGDRLLNQQLPFFVDFLLFAPGNPLRLADGSLVMYTRDGLGWWGADGRLVTYHYWDETTAGTFPRLTGKSGGIALGADGKTVYYADLADDGRLVLGRTQLQR